MKVFAVMRGERLVKLFRLKQDALDLVTEINENTSNGERASLEEMTVH